MTCKNEQIILTRYLYNKTEVKHSLFLSILEHNIDEALFGVMNYITQDLNVMYLCFGKIMETIFVNSCSFMIDYAIYNKIMERGQQPINVWKFNCNFMYQTI